MGPLVTHASFGVSILALASRVIRQSGVFLSPPAERRYMSTPTKVVLVTTVLSVLIGIGIVVNVAVAG